MVQSPDGLLAALTVEEKAALTAGADFWSTVAIPRAGIPSVRVTDGPNGARGATFGPSAPPSVCVPCGSALGATWDPALVERVGALLGREARDRGCRVLLAPTVNLHRSPIAGRNFECYSEDPLLSGRLAAGFVRGVQSQSVAATVKHFVANDAEFERGSISSVVHERSLRELYLVPFEMAVRDGGALAIMTSYNRLNGRWLTEQPEMLTTLLRDEWGFDGIVMSDWFGVAGTVASAGAGLDLEMPGPGRAYGGALAAAVREGTVPLEALDAIVRRLLVTFDRVGALTDGDPVVVIEDRPEDRALTREAAAASTVLLRNDGVLPLAAGRLRRVAVLGPNAASPSIMGGGSAQVTSHAVRTPLEALQEAFGATVDVVHERGCSILRSARPLGSPGMRGDGGFSVEVFDGPDDSAPIVHRATSTTAQFLFFGAPPGVTTDDWSVRLRGRVVAAERGGFTLSLAQSGRARVDIDGVVVLDGEADPPPPGGEDFFGLASQELLATVDVSSADPIELAVHYRPAGAVGLFGAKVGFRVPEREDQLARAVTAAGSADVAIVVVGTNEEWERETHDRSSMRLPGRQDELIADVAAVNPRTIVVVNAGAPVEMPWAEDVAAVLQCWFGGQELGPALADVLTGAAEPAGRLPTTIPMRLEHNPSFDNFPGENGELRYGEGLFMGYRGYEHRRLPVRYPFGHGSGYTTFALGEPALSAPTFVPGDVLSVTVPVTNTGSRRGSEVVQLYVAPDAPRLARPPKELKSFAKVTLDPGESVDVVLTLDDRAFAYWDPGQPDWDTIRPRLGAVAGVEGRTPTERRPAGWQVDPGSYELLVGRSSADVLVRATIRVT
jgi:beta-glucosidase